jgi:outer membrane biosynthesis protein TonB
MASTTSVPATRSPFAHLGKSQAAAAAAVDDAAAIAAKKAEEDEKAKKEDDDEEAKKKAKKEEDDKEAKKAEEDEAKAEEEKKAKKKAKKKSEGDDGDDESDREDEANAEARVIRAHERGRIRAIVNSEAGLANPSAAYELACNDSMSRNRALAMLRAVGPAVSTETRTDALRDRMAHTAQIDIGVSETQSSATLAQQIVAAGKKRRGEV